MAAGSAKKKKQHGEDNKAPAQDGDNNSSTKLYIEVQDEADEETEDKKASDLAISLDRANSVAENLKKLIYQIIAGLDLDLDTLPIRSSRGIKITYVLCPNKWETSHLSTARRMSNIRFVDSPSNMKIFCQ